MSEDNERLLKERSPPCSAPGLHDAEHIEYSDEIDLSEVDPDDIVYTGAATAIEVIKGRVTCVRYCNPADDEAQEDGGDEHEAAGNAVLYNVKVDVLTLARVLIVVKGVTDIDPANLQYKDVAISGGTYGADDYDAHLLEGAAITAIEIKTGARAIFTRAGLSKSQIKKVIDHFGEEKVIEILAGDDGLERIVFDRKKKTGVKGITAVTAKKFLDAAQANVDVSLEILTILVEAGVAGHKALKLVRKQFLRDETPESLAHKLYKLVYEYKGLRFYEAEVIANHPRIAAIKSYDWDDPERIIGFIMDVMTHEIAFGFKEYVYQGHCGYFFDARPFNLARAMPPPLKEIFLSKWSEGTAEVDIVAGSPVFAAAFGKGEILSITESPAGEPNVEVKFDNGAQHSLVPAYLKATGVPVTDIKCGARVSVGSFGEGTILSIGKVPMKVAGVQVKFDTGEQRLLSPSTLTSPIIGEITEAWNSARTSKLWKEIFIEVFINGEREPILYIT